MPLYEFYCEKCEKVWDDLIPIKNGKAPERRKCPECKKMSKRWISDVAIKVKGVTEQSLRRQKRFEQYGMEKEQAETFLKDAIEASKERMKSGGEHYRRVRGDMDTLVKKGQAKTITPAQKQKKEAMIKEIAIDIKKVADAKKISVDNGSKQHI